MEKFDFAGGVAVVTGAASGIGEAMARHAALELGMRVVLADISDASLRRLAQELESKGATVLPLVTDVREPDALDALARQSFNRFGEVNLLVNNAGIEMMGLSWELGAEQWEQLLRVNIHGVVHGARAFLPEMIASGKPCLVANMASVAAVSVAPVQAGYVMSKHAVLAFSECLKLELRMKTSDVHVAAILPGAVRTNIIDSVASPKEALAAEHHREMLALMEKHGIAADEAAARIFTQLQAGKFWVSPHPEMLRELAGNRADVLSSI